MAACRHWSTRGERKAVETSKVLGARESGVTTPPTCSAWGSPIFFGNATQSRSCDDLGTVTTYWEEFKVFGE